jgi:hypothetical protein
MAHPATVIAGQVLRLLVVDGRDELRLGAAPRLDPLVVTPTPTRPRTTLTGQGGAAGQSLTGRSGGRRADQLHRGHIRPDR